MTHKESPIPKANWLIPLGVGGFKSENIIESDDQYDDNISQLNKYYCELTGIYHAWKNSDAEYIGISHYRRYLNILTIPDNNNAWLSAEASPPILDFLAREDQKEKTIDLLEHYDMILPRAIHSNISAENDYLQAHYQLDKKQKEFLKHSTFYGNEIVASTRRLCLMNMVLHNIGPVGKCRSSTNLSLMNTTLCALARPRPWPPRPRPADPAGPRRRPALLPPRPRSRSPARFPRRRSRLVQVHPNRPQPRPGLDR